jgi:cytochrome c biogenesis protein CcdA
MTDAALLEGTVWFISMCLVGTLSIFFATKLRSMKPNTASMPKINSTEGSRLFFVFGINYLVVAFACVALSLFTGTDVSDRFNQVIFEWWFLEIFVFFNLITSYCLYTAIKRVVVNV